MHSHLKQTGIYALMAINTIVGFTLLWYFSEFSGGMESILRDFRAEEILYYVLPVFGPLCTVLYALYPRNRWTQIGFALISVLSVLMLIFIVIVAIALYRAFG